MSVTDTALHLASTKAGHVALSRRRWLQLVLAGIWLYAGLLQAQTFMFTRDFSGQVLDPTASGNPHWIASTVHWSSQIVGDHPLAWNLVFMLVQMALGLGIAFRPTLKLALAGSIAWSLMVWWFGEGLGGLLTGGASPLNGAPGAVLLYAVLAVLLWPVKDESPAGVPFVAARPIGADAAKAVWVVLWAGLALLNLQSANWGKSGLHDLISGMGAGQPGWVNDAVNSVSHFSAGKGIWLTSILIALLLFAAVGILLPPPIARSAVIVALVVSTFIWLIGEALGTPFGGQATDPNSGPLLILIAVAFWPLVSNKTSIPPEVN